jgi:predicted PurR-regulated permease PerM
MTKQLAVIAMAIMATLLGLAAFWQFRIAIIYVLISLLLAATFRPMARDESRRDLVTRLGLSLKYLMGLGIVGLLIFLAGRLMMNDFQQLVENLSEESTWMLPEWFVSGTVQQSLFKWLPTPSQLLEALSTQRQPAMSAILGITQSIGTLISGLVIIIFLSIYWSINQNHFERLWLSLLPAELRKRARYIWRTIEHDLGAYTRSELIQSILAILLLGLGYWALGSPYATLLAVTGGIVGLVPVVGAVLATVLPFLLGLLTSTPLGLTTVLYTLLVFAVLQVWVEPRLFKLKWDNPVLTFVILLAMADAFGLLGVIAAPPLSVICQILWKFLVTDRLSAEIGVQLHDLKERQTQLQAAIDQMEGPPPPLVTSSMERLSDLIEKSEPILDGKMQSESNIFQST